MLHDLLLQRLASNDDDPRLLTDAGELDARLPVSGGEHRSVEGLDGQSRALASMSDGAFEDVGLSSPSRGG